MKRIWIAIITIIIIVIAELLTNGPPVVIDAESSPELAEQALVIEPIDFAPEPEKALVEPVAKPEPKPAPVPKPVAIPASGNCSLVNNYNWDARVAYGICMAESSGNPQATNMADNHGKCIGSYGLMQIGCFWFPYFGYSLNQAYTGEVNVAVAYQIWQRQGGFGAWTTYTSGKYLRYL